MFGRRHRHGRPISPQDPMPSEVPAPQQITAFPLPMARIGQPCEIVEIHGGLGIRHHLTDLGFIPGTKVTVAAAHGGGIIVRMLDTRIMLGRGMAHHIRVRPME